MWGTPYHLFFLSTVFPVRENQYLSSPLHITASTGRRCHLGTQEQSTHYLLGSQGWNRNSCDLQAVFLYIPASFLISEDVLYSPVHMTRGHKAAHSILCLHMQFLRCTQLPCSLSTTAFKELVQISCTATLPNIPKKEF